jgi:hypothetical protein
VGVAAATEVTFPLIWPIDAVEGAEEVVAWPEDGALLDPEDPFDALPALDVETPDVDVDDPLLLPDDVFPTLPLEVPPEPLLPIPLPEPEPPPELVPPTEPPPPPELPEPLPP